MKSSNLVKLETACFRALHDEPVIIQSLTFSSCATIKCTPSSLDTHFSASKDWLIEQCSISVVLEKKVKYPRQCEPLRKYPNSHFRNNHCLARYYASYERMNERIKTAFTIVKSPSLLVHWLIHKSLYICLLYEDMQKNLQQEKRNYRVL